MKRLDENSNYSDYGLLVSPPHAFHIWISGSTRTLRAFHNPIHAICEFHSTDLVHPSNTLPDYGLLVELKKFVKGKRPAKFLHERMLALLPMPWHSRKDGALGLIHGGGHGSDIW